MGLSWALGYRMVENRGYSWRVVPTIAPSQGAAITLSGPDLGPGSNPVSPTCVWPCQRPLFDHIPVRVQLSCNKHFRIDSVSPRSRRRFAQWRQCRLRTREDGLSSASEAVVMCACLLFDSPSCPDRGVPIGLVVQAPQSK